MLRLSWISLFPNSSQGRSHTKMKAETFCTCEPSVSERAHGLDIWRETSAFLQQLSEQQALYTARLTHGVSACAHLHEAPNTHRKFENLPTQSIKMYLCITFKQMNAFPGTGKREHVSWRFKIKIKEIR